MAGDFSPLTIDAGHAGGRFAPPAMLVATAIGLGSMDMPVPSIAEWEWVNWKFPRPVRAGDTIYARWTLTQKRAPVGSAPTAIVVWRVDVHTADGALCAEGEVGASVRRHVSISRAAVPGADSVQTAAPSRRRRGRRSAQAKAEPPMAAKEPTPPAPTAPPVAEKAATPRRRRRRRSRTGTPSRDAQSSPPAPAPQSPPAESPAPAAARPPRGALGRVIKRLRRI